MYGVNVYRFVNVWVESPCLCSLLVPSFPPKYMLCRLITDFKLSVGVNGYQVLCVSPVINW